MTFDNSSLELAKKFFQESDECPLCTQIEHMQYMIQGFDIEAHVHDPILCLYSWIALVAVLDNAENKMTPEQLKVYVDRLTNSIIEELNKEKHGGLRNE